MAKQTDTSLASLLLRTRAMLVAVSFTLTGWALIVVNGWISDRDLGFWNWLHSAQLGELGGMFFAAGAIGTIMDYSARRAQSARQIEEYREVNRQQIPEIRDSVLEAFNIEPAQPEARRHARTAGWPGGECDESAAR